MWAIAVKSGCPGAMSGLAAFQRKYPHGRAMVVGSGGWALEEFLAEDPRSVFRG